MRLLAAATGAVVLVTSLTAVSAPATAVATTDLTPPAVGSCFNLTYDEIHGASSDAPPVPCSSPHTTLTFDVVELAEPPDWNDEDSFESEVYEQCNLSWIAVLGGDPKTIVRSSYRYVWLMPTPAQREAGAAWVRCELMLGAGLRTARLPQDVRLGRLPLPDSVALCRQGERGDLRVTVCTLGHKYRATHSARIPGTRWPGYDQVKDLALRACDERLRGDFRYQWPSSRYWWRLGFRHATCLKPTAR